jgi:chromosome segregation ATPase
LYINCQQTARVTNYRPGLGTTAQSIAEAVEQLEMRIKDANDGANADLIRRINEAKKDVAADERKHAAQLTSKYMEMEIQIECLKLDREKLHTELFELTRQRKELRAQLETVEVAK